MPSCYVLFAELTIFLSTPALRCLLWASRYCYRWLTGIVFGIAPAWMASQSSPGDALRGAGRSMGDRSSILQKPLVIAQVAFSIVLLIGAGSGHLKACGTSSIQDFGFVTESRLIVNINPSSGRLHAR